ncbi:MAG: hypothetical protein U5K37_10925 [Natrialbaceae archaeon]|nr:hypothetical protein [Natrialbaceae archaeon]
MLKRNQRMTTKGALGRRSAMVLGAGALGATAGCLDWLSDGESSEHISYVPSNATVLGELDPASFSDEGNLELINVIVEYGPDLPVIDLLETFLQDDTPSMASVSDLVFFAQTDEDLSLDLEMLGTVVTAADWAEEDVVAAMEAYAGVSYSEGEYAGSAVYSPSEKPLFAAPLSLGVLDAEAGVYVAGDTPAVEGAIDVAQGNDEVVSGPVLSAFNDMAGEDGTLSIEAQGSILPAAIESEFSNQGLNPSPFESVESLAGTYDASDGLSAEANMYTNSASDAESITNIMTGILAVLRGQTADPTILEEIDKLDIGLHPDDEEIIHLTYESNIDAVVNMLETVFTLLDEQLGYGRGGGSSAAAFDVVPAQANAVASVDSAVLTDPNFQSLAAVTGDSLSAVFEEGGSVLGLLDLGAIESETSLSFEGVSDLVGYATLAEEMLSPPERVAVILTADWDTQPVVDGMETYFGTTYTTAEYEGQSVLYEPASPDGVYIGVLSGSRFVFGDRAGVEATLDVVYAEAATVEGPVLEAYNNTEAGDVVGAIEPAGALIPPETGEELGIDLSAFGEVDTLSGSYVGTESSVEASGQIVANNTEAASQMGGLIPLALDSLDWARP